MLIPLVNSGKKPEELHNVRLLLPLPAHTPFGNLCLKIQKILERLDHVNIRIQDLNKLHSEVLPELLKGGMFTHRPTNDHHLGDEIIFWLKRTVDELISLIFIKNYHHLNQSYPDQIEIDSVGLLLGKINDDEYIGLFKKYQAFLELVNDLANSHKHSFINSDMNVRSLREPQIFALRIKKNDSKNIAHFYSIPVREIVDQFNVFFLEMKEELRRWS